MDYKRKLKKVWQSLPIALAVVITATTSAFAFSKIYSDITNPGIKLIDVDDVSSNEANVDVSPSGSSSLGGSANVNTTANTNANATGGITLAQLSTHNTAGDCYVAYNGTVYNASSHYAWSGCSHFGISGGSDITSRFPHPTSYLSGLPVIGKLVDGGTNPGTDPVNPIKDGDDDDDEYEYEDEDEHEDEKDEDERDDR